MELHNSFKTLATATDEILFKEKKSKFYGYAFPIQSEVAAKEQLEQLKKRHPVAQHFCYAYQLGTDKVIFRINDDGEPHNSAGMPIYGQIQSFAITNVLLVVVRYFGGTKLGVGGLISAYKKTAQLVLNDAVFTEESIDKLFKIIFEYKNTAKVMRVIKEKKLKIIDQKMQNNCEIHLATKIKDFENIFEIFNRMYEIEAKNIE